MRYVWHDGAWVDAGEYYRKQPPKPKFPTIIHDRIEYRSMLTDEMITSRSRHREHLKAHGVQEVGDEKPGWMRERDRMRKDGLSQQQIEAEEQRSREQQPDPGISFQWEDLNG